MSRANPNSSWGRRRKRSRLAGKPATHRKLLHTITAWVLRLKSWKLKPCLNRIILGNCLKKLRKLPDACIDVIITDPPYGLKYAKLDWDKAVPPVQVWKECFRVLKPGAFALVMSSPRQDCLCRMIVNLQEAGFVTSFTSLYWTYNTGVWKALNVAKAVDKRLGVKPKVIGKRRQNKPKFRTTQKTTNKKGINNANRKYYNVTVPTSRQAKALAGAYAGYQPKPAVEVILLAMKPLEEKTFIDQALKNRKGITNLSDCKVPSPERLRLPANLLVSDDSLKKSSRYYSLDAWMKKRLEDLPLNVGKLVPLLDVPFLVVPKPSIAERNAGVRKSEQEPSHPTQKPLKLLLYLVTLASRRDEIVLDPFVGTGTAAVAAKMLYRRYIGIDLDRKYCLRARMRLKMVAHAQSIH
jgi:DNA modification methylase